MEVSAFEVVLKLLDLDINWVKHMAEKWDFQRDKPGCDCVLSRQDDFGDFEETYCDEWSYFLQECYRYLNNNLTPAEVIARRNDWFQAIQDRAAEISDKRRTKEWEDMKRRGLTP